MKLDEILTSPITDDGYIEFVEWADSIEEDQINEALIPASIKKKFKFIKELAFGMRVKIRDVISFFKDRKIFKFFSKIKFSMIKLHALLKKGFKAYQDMLTAISAFISKSKVGRWTEQKLKALDVFLQTHPKTKRLIGVAIAALLVYIWFNMTFTGDPAFDFGMDDLLLALAGKFKLSTLFAGAGGTKLLLLFATGAIGLSFPWPGPSKIQFAVAIVQTLARKVKAKFTPDNNPLEAQ